MGARAVAEHWRRKKGTAQRHAGHPGRDGSFPMPMGPPIWTHPMVPSTFFVNDALARELLGEPSGQALGLKQVRLSGAA
jgi:hypothetical protein